MFFAAGGARVAHYSDAARRGDDAGAMRAQSLLLYTLLLGVLVIWAELSTGLFRGTSLTRPALAPVHAADPSAARRAEVEPRDWAGHRADVVAAKEQDALQIPAVAAPLEVRASRGDNATPDAHAVREESGGRESQQHASAQNISSVVAPLANANGTVTHASVWSGDGPFIALGIVSNCMWGNSFDRRYWIRRTFMTYSNVGRSMSVTFIVAMLQSDLSPVPESLAKRLRREAAEYGDMLLLERVPERKSPCLKTMAWYRHALQAYPAATFIAKTDDDAYVHTVKLEVNMRRFAHEPLVYIGSTLWGTYIVDSFEACARRMGPMMCAGGMKEERCAERGAIGPYPYAVGMLQVLSRPVATWMVAQPAYEEFERRATAATKPPMMDHGEDMVIGMFIYQSPWPLMPLHWGWDKLHDLCFKCERTDQIWRPITWQTVVAHHVANAWIMQEIFHNISAVCDDACVHQELPFEVKSLEDLCRRGQIAKVYSKCKMVGRGDTGVSKGRGAAAAT